MAKFLLFTPPTIGWAIPLYLKYCHYFTWIIWLNLFNFYKFTVCCQHSYSCFKNEVAKVSRGGHNSTHGQTYCLGLPSVRFPATRVNQHHGHAFWDKWKIVLNGYFLLKLILAFLGRFTTVKDILLNAKGDYFEIKTIKLQVGVLKCIFIVMVFKLL